MAKAKPLMLCPSCGEELESLDLKECPVCLKVLKYPDNPFFGFPDYLTYQLEKLLDDNGAFLEKGPTGKQKETIKEIRTQFVVWARQCPPEDTHACLQDAVHLLANILHSDAQVDDLRGITALAKQIGKMGEAIENYFRNGGELHVRKLRPVQAESGGHAGSTASVD